MTTDSETKTVVNLGHITEIVVAVFFAELLNHIDFLERKLDSSFSEREFIDTIHQGMLSDKYKLGQQVTLKSVKNKDGDDISIKLSIITGKTSEQVSIKYLFDNYNHDKDLQRDFKSILSSFRVNAFVRNVFVSRSLPFSYIHHIISEVQSLLKNNVPEYIHILVKTAGHASGKRQKVGSVSAAVEFVPKADVVITLNSKEKQTGKAAKEIVKNFSVKGNSQTIESPGYAAVINILYALAESPPPFFKEYFRKIKHADSAKNFFAEMRKTGSLKCSKTQALKVIKGIISGSDDSLYLKVDKTGISTIDLKTLSLMVNESNSVYIVPTNNDIRVEARSIIGTHLLFKISHKSNSTFQININKNIMVN